MKALLLLSCALVAQSIIFKSISDHLKLPKLSTILGNLRNGGQNGNLQLNYSNVCVYSSDPSKFVPKCFLCPDTAYEPIVKACVPETDGAYNVSYDQAACMERNCGVQHPTGATSITEIRVKREESKYFDSNKTSNPVLNSKSFPDGMFKVNLLWSYPLHNNSRSSVVNGKQLVDFDDVIESDLYQKIPKAKIQSIVVINNTEYAISHQDVFFAVDKA